MPSLDSRTLRGVALIAGPTFILGALITASSLTPRPVVADGLPISISCPPAEERVLHPFGSIPFESPRAALNAQVLGRGVLGDVRPELFEENRIDEDRIQFVYRSNREPKIVFGVVATGRGTWSINQLDYCVDAPQQARVP